MYVEAHCQHFGVSQQTLAAWQAYLAIDPSGPPLLETCYDRAVTLLRLGPRKGPEQAPLPFARGEHADFRQLLQQLAR